MIQFGNPYHQVTYYQVQNNRFTHAWTHIQPQFTMTWNESIWIPPTQDNFRAMETEAVEM